MTTVGYGDFVPTSRPGRALNCFLMILSILILTLPVSVIGQTFSLEMNKYNQEKIKRNETLNAELLNNPDLKYGLPSGFYEAEVQPSIAEVNDSTQIELIEMKQNPMLQNVSKSDTNISSNAQPFGARDDSDIHSVNENISALQSLYNQQLNSLIEIDKKIQRLVLLRQDLLTKQGIR